VRGRQERNEQILVVDRLAKLGLGHVTAANTTTCTLMIASTLAVVAWTGVSPERRISVQTMNK
jgi:hypothetical protein